MELRKAQVKSLKTYYHHFTIVLHTYLNISFLDCEVSQDSSSSSGSSENMSLPRLWDTLLAVIQPSLEQKQKIVSSFVYF